jgi:hypothetical protein
MSSYRASGHLKLAWLALLISLLPVMATGGGEVGKKPLRLSVAQDGFQGPVPNARCGPTDWTETGLQGATTTAERLSGLSELGFQCNLELVGQYQGQGAKYMANWFDDCAYMAQTNNPNYLRNNGVVVIDASDPRRPRPVTWLDSPTMRDPHEGLTVNERRRILAATQFGPGYGFAVYDLSNDCRNPRLASSIVLPRNPNTSPNAGPDGGHAGSISPDGKTYYGSHAFRGIGGIVSIVDMSDINNAKSIVEWQYPGDGRGHDYGWSLDGMRMYANQPGQFANPITGSSYGPNGLVILDVSDIQLRRPNPQIRVVNTYFWVDGGQGQQALLIHYNGVPHLVMTDDAGSGGAGGRTGACARGVNGIAGYARIIDIGDEMNPRTVSKLMLDSQNAANCATILTEDDDSTQPVNYSSHYCAADKVEDPNALACTYRDGGLRVFNIKDPYNPSEIAYYKPPARRTQFLPGSALWSPAPTVSGKAEPGPTGSGTDRLIDHTPTLVRWRHYKDEVHLWFASQDNGFQIVAFTNDVLKGLIPADERFDGDNNKENGTK